MNGLVVCGLSIVGFGGVLHCVTLGCPFCFAFGVGELRILGVA